MKCPKCDFDQPDSRMECLRCGVIFSKIPGFHPPPPPPETVASGARPASRPNYDQPHGKRAPRRRDGRKQSQEPTGHKVGASAPLVYTNPPEPSTAHYYPEIEDDEYRGDSAEDYLGDISSERPEPRLMEATTWIILGVSIISALLIKFFPLVNHIFMTFTTLVHEMGHAIFGWLFAYPSLPAFDLRYGGGITMHMTRSTPLLLFVYAGFFGLMFLYRKNPLTIGILIVLLILHGLLSYGSGHDVLILFMGHGTELLIAAVFIYRALSSASVVHAAERPLYGIIGFFIFFSDAAFGYRLYSSHFERHFYETAKGGGHWMDFSRIAEEYLHVPLESVAFFFLLCCLVTPVIGYLMFRYQEYLRALITRVFAIDPSQSR